MATTANTDSLMKDQNEILHDASQSKHTEADSNITDTALPSATREDKYVGYGRMTADDAARTPHDKSGTPVPLNIHGQSHVVLNIAKTIDNGKSAIRVVAFVKNLSSARDIINEHTDKGNIPFIMHPTHKWKLITSLPSNGSEDELKRINKIYEDRLAEMKKSKNEFNEYCTKAKKLGGRENANKLVIEHNKQQLEVLARERERMHCIPEDDEHPGATKEIDSDHVIQGESKYKNRAPYDQNIAVIGIIHAIDCDDLIICAFAAFENIDKARKYARDTLSDEYNYFDASCVDTNEWIHPHLSVHNSIERGYRHQLLNDVMKYKHFEKDRIRRHKKKCDDLGVAMRTTTI